MILGSHNPYGVLTKYLHTAGGSAGLNFLFLIYMVASGPLGAQLVPEVLSGKLVLIMGDEEEIMTSCRLEWHICIS